MKRITLISIRVYWIVTSVLGLSALSSANTRSGIYAEVEQHFNKANDLLKNMDYDAAIAEYNKVVTMSSDSEIAQDAQYWIGQSYFRAGQFESALSAFQKILDDYPGSKAIPSTKLMIQQVQEAKKTKPLFEAVKKGDTEQVKLLVSQGINVNSRDAWDRIPLHYAAEADKLEIAQLLIKAGADLNCKDKNNETPIIMARKNWNREVVKLLVLEGANADLDTLAYLGDIARVKSYVHKDSDVNESQLSWALLAALNEAHIGVAEFLLEKGANINLKDRNNATILHSWGWGGDPDDAKRVIKFAISKGADVNALQGDSRWTPLHSACSRGRESVAEVLIDNGADVNAKDRHGHTPLYFAVRRKDLDTIKLLVVKSADVNIKDNSGWTPLHLAAYYGDKDLAKLLIARGAYIEAKNRNGRTPLYTAVNKGSKDVVELLIAEGADVNVSNNSGRTSLHIAASKGNEEVVELLISHNAKVDAEDITGATPLGFAEENGHSVTAELLRKRGATISVGMGNTPLHQAVMAGDIAKAKSLIYKGTNINARNIRGRTPLIVSAVRGKIDMAKVLIAGGADVNVKGNGGRTPLAWTILRGDKDFTELLIEKNANINIKGNYGHTPIHYAVYSGSKDLVELLIAHNADVDAKDQGGVTPLGLAEEKGHSEIAELLRKKGARISKGTGETPLNKAVIAGDTSTVRSLIAEGASVNAKNSYGYTPLHLTCLIAERMDHAKLLVAAGADVNAKDIYGHTPLWHAQDRRRTEIVELLLKHRAEE